MNASEFARIKVCLKKLFSKGLALEWKEVWEFIGAIAQDLEEKDARIEELEGENTRIPDIMHDVIATGDGLIAENAKLLADIGKLEDKIAELEKVIELMAEKLARVDSFNIREYYIIYPEVLIADITKKAHEILAERKEDFVTRHNNFIANNAPDLEIIAAEKKEKE